MSIRYSSAAGVAILLFATVCASPAAQAAESAAATVETCASGKSVVFRTIGHPGKSTQLRRSEVGVQHRCTGDTGKGLMLVSFTDAPGGEALLDGKADRAIHLLSRSADAGSTLVLNNLCVAHTALRQWSDAQTTCDAAVLAAAKAQSAHQRWPGARRQLANSVAAAVYSNRAVMKWLSQDAMAAQGDFARARAIAPKAAFVVRNAELAPRLPASR